MRNLYDLLKAYGSLVGVIGLSLAQVLNLRPFDQSGLAFAIFTILAAVVVVSSFGIVRDTKLVRHPTGVFKEPVYDPRARRAAAVVLVFTLPVYGILALLFHIPNTWPIEIRPGAELRDMNPWIRILPGGSLDLGLDEQAGRLFIPDRRVFSISQPIHRVTIDNRSTVPSPPLALRLTLHAPPGWALPPAVFAAAVATPGVHRWLPFGDLLRTLPILRHWLPVGGAFGGLPAIPHWLPYNGPCGAQGAVEGGWCFSHPPDIRHDWREPEIHLPSIPPRDSFEVYLEVAFPKGVSLQTVPATVDLRNAADGNFRVSVRREVDLNAGIGGR